MNTGILISVLAYELLITVGLGLWLARRAARRALEDGSFTLGGRRLPLGVVAVTLALTVLGTAHILGIFEMSWYLGAAAVWFGLAHVILLVVVCLTTGVWVRRLGATTVPEILEMFYGPGTRLIVSCVMAGVIFGILTLETQGVGIIIASMTGWSIRTGAVVGGMLGICYVVFAGMTEVAWINLVNAAVMYLGIILATIVLALALPGGNFQVVTDYYRQSGDAFMLSIYGTPRILLTFALGTTVAVVFSQGINQMLLQPAMSADSELSIRRALWIAAPVNGLFGVFTVVIGLTAKAMPEFRALGPKVAATSMLVSYLPGWLAALLLASFLAAILSTFAMTSLSPATIFSMDIYRHLYNPQATERQVKLVTRVAIVLLAAIAIAMAAFLPPILAAINWLFSWLVPVFWIVVFGFLWKRNAATAVTTLVVAWIANSLWSFTPLPAVLNLSDLPNAYVTLAATLLVGVGMNVLAGGQPGYLRSDQYLAKFGARSPDA